MLSLSFRRPPSAPLVLTHHKIKPIRSRGFSCRYRHFNVTCSVFPQTDANIAILIDADNTPVSYMTGLFDEVSKIGTPVVKRCYGDFSLPNLKQWRKTALRHSISTEQQFAYTSGKNATDIRLVIDAMDMLYSPQFNVDLFIIVSSDSDFAPLASRLRMAGKKVYAAGQRKTPLGFKNSVNQFIVLETLRKEETEYDMLERLSSTSSTGSSEGLAYDEEAFDVNRYFPGRPSDAVDSNLERYNDDSVETFEDDSLESVEALLANVAKDLMGTEENITLAGFPPDDDEADTPGYVYLRSMARLLGRRSPGFSCRNYGYETLEELLRSFGIFEMKKVHLYTQSGKRVRHLVIKFADR